MATCARCKQNVSFWMGGVDRQTGFCRTCTQEVRMQTLFSIRNGILPRVQSSILLETDEVCHMDLPVTYVKENPKSMKMVQGRFIATSKRLYFLAFTNTYTISWNDVLQVTVGYGNSPTKRPWIYLQLSHQSGTGMYEVPDAEYVQAILDTLARMAKRQIVSSNSVDAMRQIPQDVKAAVWQRDGGRCRQCGAQQYLEFDHIIPVSKGGANTVNVQLLCRMCNAKKGAHI